MTYALEQFKNIVLQEYKEGIEPLPRLTFRQLKQSTWLPEAQAVFQRLEGKSERLPIFPRNWDLTIDTTALVWDDPLHFNRYRRATLRAEIYSEAWKGFQKMKYSDFCRKHEGECLKAALAGAVWHNRHAEEAFGRSETPGDLGGMGSAGWKYRAWQDYLQDLAATVCTFRIVRFSTWDELMVNRRLVRLGELLMAPTEEQTEILLNYVKRRIENA